MWFSWKCNGYKVKDVGQKKNKKGRLRGKNDKETRDIQTDRETYIQRKWARMQEENRLVSIMLMHNCKDKSWKIGFKALFQTYSHFINNQA